MHAPIQLALKEALIKVFDEGAYADKVLEQTFKNNKKFGSRDRRQLAEAFYDIVRHYRLLKELVDAEGADQLLDFYLSNQETLLNDRQSFSKSFAIQESVEDSMYELLVDQLGESIVQKELCAMNELAVVCLRTNTLKCERKTLIQRLTDEGIPVELAEGNSVGVYLKERKNVFVTKAFKEGLFEVQDFGSQHIAPLLNVEPGQRVVDACAGAGGKSLHLAAIMENKGRILALDIHEWKLKELKLRARRAGASTIEGRPIINQKVIKRLHASADRLLLDVPCTGIGVLKRNPDSKMKWSMENYKNLLETQQQILESYHKILKPGGKFVYATCSILPAENENQVRGFLERHPGQWKLEEEIRLMPSQGRNDGFYAARLAHVSS